MKGLGRIALAAVAAGIAVSAWALGGVSPAAAQIRPFGSATPAAAQIPSLGPGDPLEQSRAMSLHPVPTLPAPPPPAERLVPERRIRIPETGQEIVIPSHYERRITDQQYSVPPLTGYDARGQGTVVIPGGERPPADLRQSP
jgi:hypothetical protein